MRSQKCALRAQAYHMHVKEVGRIGKQRGRSTGRTISGYVYHSTRRDDTDRPRKNNRRDLHKFVGSVSLSFLACIESTRALRMLLQIVNHLLLLMTKNPVP
jgi:hypothetical protein